MKTDLTKKEQAYLEVRDALSFKFFEAGTHRILSVEEVLNESIHVKNETLATFIHFWMKINAGTLTSNHYPSFVDATEPVWMQAPDPQEQATPA